MPNVVRGDRTGGLMVYLVGPGRSNEHTEPHLVAGDGPLMTWHDDDELGRDAALAIARHLDRPMKAYGVTVKGGHVWHCSLSLRAEEGQLTDEKWGEISRHFVREMGFDDEASGKAPTRWVAVRHGLSGGGNDHIHIAVNLVREDGTRASTHLDFRRAQKVTRALEVAYGLEPLEGAAAERATRGYSPAERQAQARARAAARYERERQAAPAGAVGPGWYALPAEERAAKIAAAMPAEQPRHTLARKVRGCATASGDEAEFVRRMRRGGVLVRPRFADGRTDVVTGYSVAARPLHGERPIWYGGGHLGRDLALPRLRAGWPDTPQGATDAAAEWVAARRGRRVVAEGREAVAPDPKMWQTVLDDTYRLREQMRAVPIEDRDQWARVARETAGAFAAWSNQVEETPGPLAATADALAKSAQTKYRPRVPEPAGTISAAGAAVLMMSVVRSDNPTLAQAVLLRQLMNLAKAIHDAHTAAGEAQRAAEIAQAVRDELVAVRDRMPTLVAVLAEPAPVLDDARLAKGRAAIQAPRTELEEMVERVTGAVAPATSIRPIPPRLPEPSGPGQPTQPVPAQTTTGTGRTESPER